MYNFHILLNTILYNFAKRKHSYTFLYINGWSGYTMSVCLKNRFYLYTVWLNAVPLFIQINHLLFKEREGFTQY